MLAMYYDGQVLQDITYALAGTPCETVLGQRFRAYPARLQALFPDDQDARMQGTESYAGHPLVALDGSPLGIVSVASRRPLGQVDRVDRTQDLREAAAEVERARSEALKRSDITGPFEPRKMRFVHDWDTARCSASTPKPAKLATAVRSCAAFAWPMSLGVFPHRDAATCRWLLGRCTPFEWQLTGQQPALGRGRLKPAMIDDGRISWHSPRSRAKQA
jgi:hypothetical protein